MSVCACAEALGHWTVIHDLWWDSNCQVIEVQGRANKKKSLFSCLIHENGSLSCDARVCANKKVLCRHGVPFWFISLMISLPAGSCACACVSSVLRKCHSVWVWERCSQWGRTEMGSLRPHCVRPYVWEMRVLGQYISSLMCLFVVWGLWGCCQVIDPVVCVYDRNHAGLCENPAVPDRVTPSGDGLNIYTSLHCEDPICPGERTRKTVTSNAFHITVGCVCACGWWRAWEWDSVLDKDDVLPTVNVICMCVCLFMCVWEERETALYVNRLILIELNAF